MARQDAIDKQHGRRGGGWYDGTRTKGPPCEVCGRAMLVGQRRRHRTCSPRMRCCPGLFEDDIADLVKHRQEHAELDADPQADRFRQIPG